MVLVIKIINIVDKNGGLVASIGEKDIILHNDYKVIETDQDDQEVLAAPTKSLVELIDEDLKTEPVKIRTRRTINSRHFRNEEQIARENLEITHQLKMYGKPMKLEILLRKMREIGFLHWNNSNASGFVKHAIKSGMNVKRVEFGIYSFNWGGK